jgi:hypothetical protein
LTDTLTNENQPDDDDSSSESSEETTTKTASAKVTQTPAPAATTAKAAQTPAPAANIAKAAQTPAPSVGPVKVTPKAATKSGKTLKPSKPTTVDCDKDHKVTVQDDKTVSGVLVVRSCHATRFQRKPTRCSNVGDKLTSLLNVRLAKLGIKDPHSVKISNTLGNKQQTEFHYTCPCEKAKQQAVIDSLKDSCKDKDLTDTLTNENQPDDDDSSSESSEETTTKAASVRVTHVEVTNSSDSGAGATKAPTHPTTTVVSVKQSAASSSMFVEFI